MWKNILNVSQKKINEKNATSLEYNENVSVY